MMVRQKNNFLKVIIMGIFISEIDVAKIKILFQLKEQKEREEQERLDQFILDEWDGNTLNRNNPEGVDAQNESLNSTVPIHIVGESITAQPLEII
jgi:hypothetical protein